MLRSRDDVNQPYPRVRDVLIADPQQVFRHPTSADGAPSAHVRLLDPLEGGGGISIVISGMVQTSAYGEEAMWLRLVWQPSRPNVFPAMSGTLTVFPSSATETQLELDAIYDPAGLVDDDAGHRLAAASVEMLSRDITSWLREELAPRAQPNHAQQAPV